MIGKAVRALKQEKSCWIFKALLAYLGQWSVGQELESGSSSHKLKSFALSNHQFVDSILARIWFNALKSFQWLKRDQAIHANQSFWFSY